MKYCGGRLGPGHEGVWKPVVKLKCYSLGNGSGVLVGLKGVSHMQRLLEASESTREDWN